MLKSLYLCVHVYVMVKIIADSPILPKADLREFGFSDVASLKTKYRSKLNIEY